MPRKKPPAEHVAHRIAKLIRDRRHARGLTQHDLAALLDCSFQAIRQYEQGKRSPPLVKIIMMARACDMPLSLFLAPLDDEVL